MEAMNKEQVYDEKISPLMGQIIEICREHGIAMLMDFAIGHDGEGPDGQDCTDLRCSTLLPDETGENAVMHQEALALIRRRGRPIPMHITTEHGDGTKTLTAII